ncbi:prolyl 4-hydroxylase subunit alpha-1-like isoform X2 [Drosophila montana]|uniref:prolyl 4-hydroxylase subunit alpha-1-like isoform X2 n=1 Tax=Drosophila montana TaxID=40370 RepID=UPI00313D19DB
MRSSVWTFLYIAIALTQCPIRAKAAMEQSHSTSVAGMVKLVLLEAKLIENLSSYADELEKKLNILKRAVPQLQAESNKAIGQMEQYVSNPINGFSLIRRMNQDWNDWILFMEDPLGSSQVAYVSSQKSQLPTNVDLIEACIAIYRLQRFYNLTVKDVSTGMLNGKKYDVGLNALDTYVLGQEHHKHHTVDLAGEWFAETHSWLMEHTLPTPIGADPEKMMHFFASAFFNYKYYSIALSLFDRALVLGKQTGDPAILNRRLDIEKMAREEVSVKTAPKVDATNYGRGCRGEFVVTSNLYCVYKFGSSPFLLLAPLKMEIRLLNPFIIVFHDVLSPREIDELQKLARPLLERTTVVKFKKYEKDSRRTSKGAWIERDHNNLTKRIERRITDMVELDLRYSEPFQVMNYGLGGHYAAHKDFLNNAFVDIKESDDRIATVLFYLTDVEQGGATVFTILNQAVSPKRGTALFWYNLHRNGTGDTRTLHGGCPVLVGSKWIMTLWIRERMQLFARPCLKETT